MNVPELILEDVSMIWDGAPHCAFTDLARYKAKWYCAFREGKAHAWCPGKIRVLASTDGEKWETAFVLSARSTDYRDPKLAPGPGGSLELVVGVTRLKGGRPEGRHSAALRTLDGESWSTPAQIGGEGDWIWRTERNGGETWGISYRLPGKRRWTVHLMRSADGRAWSDHVRLKVPGLPNEATVRFCGEAAIALVRREAKGGEAWIGKSGSPFSEWEWTGCGERVGGPNFLIAPPGTLYAERTPDDAVQPEPEMIAATRLWNGRTPRTSVCLMRAGKLIPLLDLPSAGDCGYPGMVLHRGKLWVSYYSSHEGRARIYLARVKIRKARRL